MGFPGNHATIRIINLTDALFTLKSASSGVTAEHIDLIVINKHQTVTD
jgi:hypothetical protein